MTYATKQDVTDRYGEREIIQLTDRDQSGAIDTGVLKQALTDADAEIDSYLAVRYALPLSTTPAVLVRLAGDIARYRLYDDRASEEVRQRYEDALKVLKSLAAGDITLGLPDDEKAGAVSAGPQWRTPPRIFDRHTLEDY